MQESETLSNPNEIIFLKIGILSILIGLVIPPIVGYFTVLFITSSFNLIGSELWSLPVVWPVMLYLGGIVGGIIGGGIALYEISLYHKKKRLIKRGKLFPPDLYYIGSLMLLTYVLEFFSEDVLMQIILFLLEVGLFAIVGFNICKILLEKEPPKPQDQPSDIVISPIEESREVAVETE